ncbi:Potential vesicular glutamate transporter vglu-3 [Eumeta japonica]|uniref:Potential vesicular glutamate transporter vglu-3 n=1 Tax=Eumeta variegata TaxID=151549 RepID=A0A4C1YZS1_EUMVA|nr:Potential vesicular glutamate transporter vglu-3 [Eumeta japonica]
MTIVESVADSPGIIGLMWSVAWFAVVYDSPAQHPRISETERHYLEKAIGTESTKKGHTPVPWRQLLLSAPVWAIVITHGASVFGYFTVVNQLPNYMKSILHYDIKHRSALAPSHRQFAVSGDRASMMATQKIRDVLTVLYPENPYGAEVNTLKASSLWFSDDNAINKRSDIIHYGFLYVSRTKQFLQNLWKYVKLPARVGATRGTILFLIYQETDPCPEPPSVANERRASIRDSNSQSENREARMFDLQLQRGYSRNSHKHPWRCTGAYVCEDGSEVSWRGVPGRSAPAPEHYSRELIDKKSLRRISIKSLYGK